MAAGKGRGRRGAGYGSGSVWDGCGGSVPAAGAGDEADGSVIADLLLLCAVRAAVPAAACATWHPDRPQRLSAPTAPTCVCWFGTRFLRRVSNARVLTGEAILLCRREGGSAAPATPSVVACAALPLLKS